MTTFITEQQVAEILQVAKKTLRDWRYRRYGPKYFKIGSRVLYQAQPIQEWIGSQERDPQSPSQSR